MKLLSIKLDVSKIDKSKLFKGAKGTYLDLTVALNDEPDQYGNDVSAWHSQSKEERDAKNDKIFLGNGKVFWTDGNISIAVKKQETGNQVIEGAKPNSKQNVEDDLPF